MTMSPEEKFLFDLNGFLVRPSILNPDEVEVVREQVTRMHTDPESLPPEERTPPGGATSLLVDHPQIVDVLHEVIGPLVRCEISQYVWRDPGTGHWQGLHRGGIGQAEPIFGYRVENQRIWAGIVHVMIELTDVEKGKGGTRFLAGSHKSNFQLPDGWDGKVDGPLEPHLADYECPAGSAVFFTENLFHAGPPWRGAGPRISLLNMYSNVAIAWARTFHPRHIIDALPVEKRAWFRDAWQTDLQVMNTVEQFIAEAEAAEANGGRIPGTRWRSEGPLVEQLDTKRGEILKQWQKETRR